MDKVMEVQQEMLMSGMSPTFPPGGGAGGGSASLRNQKNQFGANEKEKG